MPRLLPPSTWDRAWDIRPKRMDTQKIVELIMRVIEGLRDKDE